MVFTRVFSLEMELGNSCKSSLRAVSSSVAGQRAQVLEQAYKAMFHIFINVSFIES